MAELSVRIRIHKQCVFFCLGPLGETFGQDTNSLFSFFGVAKKDPENSLRWLLGVILCMVPQIKNEKLQNGTPENIPPQCVTLKLHMHDMLYTYLPISYTHISAYMYYCWPWKNNKVI